MKLCNKCNIEKAREDFFKDSTKKDGLMKSCKSCKRLYSDMNREKILNAKKIYYNENKESINEYRREYYLYNKEDLIKYSKEYYIENRDRQQEYQRNYYVENREEISLYKKKNKERYCLKIKEKLKSDPIFKLSSALRSMISRSLRNKNYKKTSKTSEILGCSFIEFKIHIENQFLEGMTWVNHGLWHFDHKIPISWAKTEEEVIRLNHYTNFQPMWAFENQSKSNRYSN